MFKSWKYNIDAKIFNIMCNIIMFKYCTTLIYRMAQKSVNQNKSKQNVLG
jgi:hypothetical protein